MFRGKRIISGIMLVLMLVSFIGCKKTSKAATFTSVSYTHLDVYKRQDVIIKAVEAAGYGASVKGAKSSSPSKQEQEDVLEDKTTPVLKKRLTASVIFLIVLMYFSMGHMMWGWPLPSVLEGNHVAMGLIQMLLTIIIMVINQHFFISGFKGLLHRSPNMLSLIHI